MKTGNTDKEKAEGGRREADYTDLTPTVAGIFQCILALIEILNYEGHHEVIGTVP